MPSRYRATERVANPHTEALRQVSDFPVGFVPQRHVKDECVLGVEAADFLDADFVIVEIRHLMRPLIPLALPALVYLIHKMRGSPRLKKVSGCREGG